MVVEYGGHQGLAFGAGTPAAGARDFGDQAVGVQALQQPGDSGALAAGGDWVAGPGAVQRGADLFVAEAVQMVFAAQDGRAGRPRTGPRRPSRRG